MRHIYVYRASYMIAALLLAGVLFIAWVRSQGVIWNLLEDARITLETTESYAWRGLGRNIFIGECSSCHTQVEGVSTLFLAEGGRVYLVNFMLYGFEGEVSTKGEQRALSHRPFSRLNDEAIAAVLNHLLVSEDNERALPDSVDFYELEEVAIARTSPLSSQAVAKQRPIQ